MDRIEYFRLPSYQRHNQRRLEHLATLDLALAGKTVLEVGAGIGDHTSFFVDRGCVLTCTDARFDLLQVLSSRYPQVAVAQWDVETPPPPAVNPKQIVYAYGLLYHTRNPDFVIESLSDLATELLLLETCVSRGSHCATNLVSEDLENPTQALSGTGCRPTRPWVFQRLQDVFPYVYVTRTQPWHEEFPLDWSVGAEVRGETLIRAVFVASRHPLSEGRLSRALVDKQTRC